jgi:predicted alternative tryptophan synthase beta-subunit
MSGVTGGVHKTYGHLRMVQEKAKEFAGCVAGASNYSDVHFPLRFCTL